MTKAFRATVKRWAHHMAAIVAPPVVTDDDVRINELISEVNSQRDDLFSTIDTMTVQLRRYAEANKRQQ